MNNKLKVIKERHSFGRIDNFYKDGKLIKKIDYTHPHPWQYTYDENGIVHLQVLPKKSNKKLWLGILGTLIILSCLYAKYKSNQSQPTKSINIPNQNTR